MKKVYIFGDRHVREDKCKLPNEKSIYIHHYLSEWMKKSDVFIDLFIETITEFTGDTDQDINKQHYLQKIRKKFSLCHRIEKNKDECYYNTSRVHTADSELRYKYQDDFMYMDTSGQIIPLPDLMISFYELAFDVYNYQFIDSLFLNQPLDYDRFDMMIRAIKRLKSYWIQFFKTLGLEFDFSKSDQPSFEKNELKNKLAKYINDHRFEPKPDRKKAYLEKISWPGFQEQFFRWNEDFFEHLSQFILEKFKEHAQLAVNGSQILSGLTNLSPEKINERNELHSIYLYLTFYISISKELQVSLMDNYLIGRMFKRFNVTDDSRMPAYANNCILYVGNYHADRYRQFLGQLNFKTIFQMYDNDQCLMFDKQAHSFMKFPDVE